MNHRKALGSMKASGNRRRRDVDALRVVVSNGAYRFHLAPLASELERMGVLSRLFTAGYPKGVFARLLEHMPHAGIQRLLDRREDLPDRRVKAFNSVEWIYKTGDILFADTRPDWRQTLHLKAFRSYARQAARAMQSEDCDILHYRSCFGFDSVIAAKAAGKVAICDHSIGHPYATSFMRRHPGATLPARLEPQPLDPLEESYLDDLALSDHVLVNSDFVRRTFLSAGYPPWRVSVAYLGVDDRFLSASDEAMDRPHTSKEPRHLLFCGGFGQRKGAFTLMKALDMMGDLDWTLTLAGGLEPEAKTAFEEFARRHPRRVFHRGNLSRDRLARLMTEHAVFVFPSEMEGSARVVFEALASGCYVVTTPQAGSIVEDGVHGALTAPGDSEGLAAALRRACSGQTDVRGIGESNAALVRSSYRQSRYASRVVDVYRKVLQRV
jgi:glycosyltransferase involved in cell wall biosynthesis